MSERLVADLIVERLCDWGVTRVFGYSGDGINAVMGALRQAVDQVEFVQARHEESAAFMAVGHAKYSGGIGVVTLTPDAERFDAKTTVLIENVTHHCPATAAPR